MENVRRGFDFWNHVVSFWNQSRREVDPVLENLSALEFASSLGQSSIESEVKRFMLGSDDSSPSRQEDNIMDIEQFVQGGAEVLDRFVAAPISDRTIMLEQDHATPSIWVEDYIPENTDNPLMERDTPTPAELWRVLRMKVTWKPLL